MKWAVAAGSALILIALILWESKGTGQEVTSKILSFSGQPTQIGAPQEIISKLSGSQLSSDVQYYIDPATGQAIGNGPGLLGSVPLVALTDAAQIANFARLNPRALYDLQTN